MFLANLLLYNVKSRLQNSELHLHIKVTQPFPSTDRAADSGCPIENYSHSSVKARESSFIVKP